MQLSFKKVFFLKTVDDLAAMAEKKGWKITVLKPFFLPSYVNIVFISPLIYVICLLLDKPH